MDTKNVHDSLTHSNLQLPCEGTTHVTKETAYLHQSASSSAVSADQFTAPQQIQNRTCDGNKSFIVHHKANDLDLRNDLDLAGASGVSQVPYILSLNGNISVPTSNYLVVNGQANPISTPVSLTSMCPSSDEVPPNISLSHQGINSALPQHGGVIIQSKQRCRQNINSNSGKCCNCAVTVSMQYSSQMQTLNNAEEGKDHKHLVPYLKTVTAEDVQSVIQSHGEKVKSGGDLNDCVVSDNFNGIGSSDFDNLDLELPDFDKLCSFLSSPVDSQTDQQSSMANVNNSLNCVNSIGKQCQGCNHGSISDIDHGGGGGQCHSMIACKTVQTQETDFSTQLKPKDLSEDKMDIVDYCPEWSYTEVGRLLTVLENCLKDGL